MKEGLSEVVTFKDLGFQWQLPMKVFPRCSAAFPCLLVKGSNKNEVYLSQGCREEHPGRRAGATNHPPKSPAVDAFTSLPFLSHPHTHLSSVQGLSGNTFCFATTSSLFLSPSICSSL